MKIKLYAVFDTAVGAFMQPLSMRSDAEAIRAFSDAVTDGKSQFCAHPDHYSLHYLGEYDDGDGRLVLPDGAPIRVIEARNCTTSPQ